MRLSTDVSRLSDEKERANKKGDWRERIGEEEKEEELESKRRDKRKEQEERKSRLEGLKAAEPALCKQDGIEEKGELLAGVNSPTKEKRMRRRKLKKKTRMKDRSTIESKAKPVDLPATRGIDSMLRRHLSHPQDAKEGRGAYTGKEKTRREIIERFLHWNTTLRRKPVIEGFVVQGAFDSEALSFEKDCRSLRLGSGKRAWKQKEKCRRWETGEERDLREVKKMYKTRATKTRMRRVASVRGSAEKS